LIYFRYGFRLNGFNGEFKFFANSTSKLESWFYALKKTCVLLHISAEFQFDKLIGKGNFAKVFFSLLYNLKK